MSGPPHSKLRHGGGWRSLHRGDVGLDVIPCNQTQAPLPVVSAMRSLPIWIAIQTLQKYAP